MRGALSDKQGSISLAHKLCDPNMGEKMEDWAGLHEGSEALKFGEGSSVRSDVVLKADPTVGVN